MFIQLFSISECGSCVGDECLHKWCKCKYHHNVWLLPPRFSFVVVVTILLCIPRQHHLDFVKILRLWIENYENCAWENKQNLKEEEPLNEVYLVNFCTFTFRQKIHKIYSQQKKLFNSLRSAFHKLNLILLTTTLPSAWKRDGREV